VSIGRLAATFTIFSWLVVLLASGTVHAERAQRSEMDNVGRNWVAEKVAQTGSWAGADNPSISATRELRHEGRLLAIIYDVEPRGYVLVPVLKELPPVQMYSDESELDIDQEGGALQMIREMLAVRLEAFEKVYGSLDYVQPSDGLYAPAQKAAWSRYKVAAKDFRIETAQGAMSQGGPLTTTSWHQHSPYNLYCPEGSDGQTVVGCVATATAQVMAYWQWPATGLGSLGYLWDGDGSCEEYPPTGPAYLTADFSDAYDWANIVDNCDGGCTAAQQAALAELCYEVGVAEQMDYGSCGSAAYTGTAAQILPQYFKYSTDAQVVNRINYTQQEWFDAIKTEIDAGRVIQYRINLHSIVCDGYRDDYGSLEYHMNYGWNDSHNAWYVLDNLFCSWVDGEICPWDEEYMIVGIHPQLDPVLSYAGELVDDAVTGDGNGHANAGESVQLFISVANNGHDATNTVATVTSTDPYVTVVGNPAALDPVIVWGDTSTITVPLQVQIAAGCPDPHLVQFDVQIQADGGFTASGSFYMFVGDTPGLIDDMESGAGFWTHRSVTTSFADQWHLETCRKHSGATSWKFGGAGGANYGDQADGALLTPPLLLPPDAKLSYWQWISAEDNGDGYSAWDGGIVMIADASGWTQLTPEGGYPYYIIANPASPFAGGTYCFSGQTGWQQRIFDLSEYSDVVQLIFRFGSDGNTNFEGWYVDDIEICNTPAGTDVVVEPAAGCTLTFGQVVTSGNTFVALSASGPTLPSSYGPVPESGGTYFEPSTSAGFTAPVEICLQYDDAGLGDAEADLVLMQYEGEEWSTLSSSVDTEANLICAEVQSLALLIVAERLTCCVGRVGDANGSGDDDPTIGDISAIIDMLLLSLTPVACLPEADINQSGGPNPTVDDVTIGDVSVLIDYLFITGESLGLSDCL